MKKHFIILSIIGFVVCQTTNLSAQKRPLKTVAKPTIDVQTLPPLTILDNGVPTNASPFTGHLKIKSIDNFNPPTRQLPQGLKIILTANGLPTMIEGVLPTTFSREKTTEARAMQYLNAIAQATHIKNPLSEWTISRTETDDIGQTHVRLHQIWQNIPVYGSEIIVHEVAGNVQRMNGVYFPTPSVKSAEPSLLEAPAQAVVKTDLLRTMPFNTLNDEQKKQIGGEQLRSTLVIFHKNDDTNAERLAYHIIAYPNVLHRYEYFIDAENGAILDSFHASCSFLGHHHHDKDGVPNSKMPLENTQNTENTEGSDFEKNNILMDGPTTANAVDLLNVTRTINTYQVGTRYYMIDASRPMFNAARSAFPATPIGAIQVLNNNNTDNGPTSYVSSTNNTWTDQGAVSAQYNGGLCYLYWKNTHLRNSINGQGGNITSFINVTDQRQSMENAYWNGEAMYYGNGGADFHPLARSLDVAGHEMSHGVIQNTANLRYQSESGALNESFADIFGIMIDRDDWRIGEDVIKNRNTFVTGFLRDLSNPNNGGTSLQNEGWQPKHMNEKYNGSEDNGGVHINSGITNYAFYLFANNAAVGKDKAEKVFFRALDKYLVASSKFIDCRAAVEQSVRDLYPADANMLAIAQNAYTSVGIGMGGSSTGTTYQQDLPVNPGNDYVVYLSADKSKLLLTTPAGANPTTLSSRGILSKPSVSDDGTKIFYIGQDKKMYVVTFNWTALTFNDQLLQGTAVWNNVAVSKDGLKIAGNQGDSLLWVYSFTLSQWKTFKLYNPTFSTNINSNIVKYSDALEWDHFGESVIYDAFNVIPNQSGTSYEFWDVGFANVWSNQQRTWGTGQVQKLFTNLAPNTSIGNPTFAKNSPYIVAFDFIDDTGASTDYLVLAANIQTGEVTQAAAGIYHNTDLGYPNFSKTDNRLLITVPLSATNGKLITVNLAANKIEPSGTAVTNIRATDAIDGVWFSNGTRVLSSTTELDKAAVQISPNPFSQTVKMDIKAEENTQGKVEIFDLLGKSVFTRPLSILNGNNTFSLDTEGLSAGVYILKVAVGQKSLAMKIMKM